MQAFPPTEVEGIVPPERSRINSYSPGEVISIHSEIGVAKIEQIRIKNMKRFFINTK
jgi:hypothetical protein